MCIIVVLRFAIVTASYTSVILSGHVVTMVNVCAKNCVIFFWADFDRFL